MNMLTLPRCLTHLRINENSSSPFHHPDIPLMIDTLNQLEKHHLLLIGIPSDKINLTRIENMMMKLSSSTIPNPLQDAHFFYCDGNTLFLEEDKLAQFKEDAQNTQKPIILILNQIELLFSNKHLQPLLVDKQWRLIIFTDPTKYKLQADLFSPFESFFSIIPLVDPSQSELVSLLTLHRSHLENFHQVTIPDEVISAALTMASHYFYSVSPFDKAFELLDTSAARTSANERTDTSGQFKPVVSYSILADIVANLTHIPSAHIQKNQFHARRFSNTISQHIFGQDKAIELIGRALQQSYIGLHEKKGPFCSFLFVGQAEVGKTTLAYALTNYLLSHENNLLTITLDKNISSLADIKTITNESKYSLNLLDAIRKIPYAVILIDDIKFEHIPVLELFKEIFMRGYVIEQGEKYDFSHAILIMTTRMGSEPINHLIRPQQESNKGSDLLQLVLNKNILDIPTQIHHTLSTQELCDQVIPILEKHFSISALQKSYVVPFVPLDFTALEKMIRLKIKNLIKTVEARYNIELGYTPEVIKFLAHEAYWRKANKPLEKLLDELLYSCVSNGILTHNQDKNRSKRLLLQLNDNGQLLKCRFLMETEAIAYSNEM